MRQTIIIIGLVFLLFGCKTNQMKNKRREGLWIEQYAQDSSHYKSIGKYRKGDPIKKWRYYLNGRIVKREKYKDNICSTTFYHENGKIKSKGKTKMETSDKYAHWFYFGDWNFFNEDGKLITIKKYNNGESFSEIEIK
jgi:antitoxin component YwqK of YwqJK toxin-antitoxin module